MRARALVAVLPLVLASCGASDPVSSTQPESPPATTVIQDYVELLSSIENTLGFIRDAGAMAWADIETVEGVGADPVMTFEVSEILWVGADAVVEGRSYSTEQFKEPEYERITAVDFMAGDRVLVWILDDKVLSAAKPDGSGGLLDSGTRHPFHLPSQGFHAGFVDHVMTAPQLPCSPAIEGVEDPTYIEALVLYLDESTPRQNWELHQQDVARIGRIADEVAVETPESVDPVLGEAVPHNDYDLIQQLLDGVDRADLVVRPTVPTYWDVSGLIEPVELVVTSGDAMLALINLTPGMSSGFDSAPSIVESFLGAPRDPALSVDVWEVSALDLAGCTIPSDYVAQAESKGELLLEIPYEDFAGATRALITISGEETTWSTLRAQEITDLTSG